jgi:tetrahydromethanopterin S-methyltransferase subunit B
LIAVAALRGTSLPPSQPLLNSYALRAAAAFTSRKLTCFCCALAIVVRSASGYS